jgi:hypothetical protein
MIDEVAMLFQREFIVPQIRTRVKVKSLILFTNECSNEFWRAIRLFSGIPADILWYLD